MIVCVCVYRDVCLRMLCMLQVSVTVCLCVWLCVRDCV